MKLSFRLVSGEQFQLDAEESTTVGELKGMLESARSITKESIKLVHRCGCNVEEFDT